MNNGDAFFDNLPKDWTITKIGAVFDIKQGKSLSSRKQTGIYLKPFLRTSNVFWGRLDLSHLDEMDFTDDECKALTLEHGDLLVCEGGDIGRTAIWKNEKTECYYQNHLHRLRVKDEKIEPLFIMYWMEVALTQFGIYEGFGNKTTIPNLSSSRLKEFILPVPEKKEQQKIAAILSKIQQTIEIQESIIEKTRDLKKSTLHHVFTHGLHGEMLKETDIGPMPESWGLNRINNLVSETTLTDPSKTPDFKIRYIDVSSVSNTRYVVETYTRLLGKDAPSRARKVVKEGDVIVATVRPTLRRIAYITPDFNNEICSTAFCVLRAKKDVLDHKYLFYAIQRSEFFCGLEKIQQGASYPAVTDTDVKDQWIPLPSVDEQSEIACCFQIVDQKIEHHTAKKSTLQDLFKIMLNKLMTGEIRVKDLEMELLNFTV